MIKNSTLSLFSLKIVAFVICFAVNSSFASDFETWYESLSDKEKIGQLFVVGLTHHHLSKKEAQLLAEWQLGGVILFKRNYQNSKQFKNLNKKINQVLSKKKLEPFLFVDQEGGNVVRIGSKYDFPSMYALGQINSSKVTHTVGESIGRLLLDNHISVNLAPVADLRNASYFNFISNRSFGENEKRVSEMVLQYSQGLYNNGVIPTLKHFPGLGDVITDSHHKTALKKTSMKELKRKDLLPYVKLSEKNIPFLTMTSHTQLIIDEKDYGITTYSKKAVNLLRKISPDHQVIITDDMEMQGAGKHKSFDLLALDSFKAGHDLILIGWSKKKLVKSLYSFLSEYKTDESFQNLVKKSLARIYLLKQNSQNIRQKYANKIIPTQKILRASAALNKKIAHYFINEKFKGQRQPSSLSSHNVVFFSSDRSFQKDIKYSQVYSVMNSSSKRIRSACSENTTCVLHVSGMKTAAAVKKIVNQNKKMNFLVLNSTDPLLTNFKNNKVKVINTYTQPKELGSLVESLIFKAFKVASKD